MKQLLTTTQQIKTSVLLLLCLVCLKTHAQCPEGDIWLQSQADVDNFIIEYPDCTAIDGDLTIWPFSGAINNLEGLSNLTIINGSVSISFTELENLQDLENLSTITGSLALGWNNVLISLSGMENINTLTGLTIDDNPNLNSLDALSNLTHLSDQLSIKNSPALANLGGLNNITASIGNIDIQNNSSLTSIAALSGITEVVAAGTTSGDITIINNESLLSLEGFNGITSIEGQLRIQNNVSLTSLQGLNNITDVKWLLLFGNTALSSLSGLENLSTTEMIRIQENNSLVNLNGLSGITSVSGDLDIQYNESLINLSGINNSALLPIGGSLVISNNTSLMSLGGLEMISSVANLTIEHNESLESLLGLSNLTEVNGAISIVENEVLTSLSGLDFINPNSVESLSVMSSENLSVCAVAGICAYLADGGQATISENATGCNNIQEVTDLCQMLPDCPNGDIQFISQAELNNFALLYPNCTELQGSVIIGHHFMSSDIENLQALNNITKINGNLTVDDNNELTNLEGLNNLTEVTGAVSITTQNNIESLQGLNNLEALGTNPETASNGLYISGSDGSVGQTSQLVNLEGLNSLTFVGGNVSIGSASEVFGHPNLTSLEGLNNLETVGGLEIWNNPALTDVSALSNITTVTSSNTTSGHIWIRYNESMPSLTGLENLVIVQEFRLTDNPGLIGLQALEGLSQVGWLHITHNSNAAFTNMEGLDNLSLVGQFDIGNNNALINLEGLEGLTEVHGDFNISNNESLESLQGLNNLTEIKGVAYLSITGNPSLTNMEGLNNLTKIAGALTIGHNDQLASLEGLNNLTSVGVNDEGNAPGYLAIGYNNALANIEALNSLTELTNAIAVEGNAQLSNLTGLEAFDPFLISSLQIQNNPLLSECATASICSYIADVGGEVIVTGNADGCDTQQQVETACENLSSDETFIDEHITLYPVPMQDILYINTPDIIMFENLTLYDASGKVIRTEHRAIESLNVSGLSAGLYFVKIKTNKGSYVQKLIK